MYKLDNLNELDKLKEKKENWECSTVVEHLPSMQEALGSIFST
jgi:phosphohistidine phosphatase SixA